MFRFHKGLDVITLFHKPSSPASIKVQALLKQAAATAGSHATEDQASDHSHQTPHPLRQEFDLDITEEPPTTDQVKSILEFVGAQKASTIIKGAKDEADALKKLRADAESFQRPVTVDWNNGRVVPGDNESEILKMLDSLPKK